jgi:hypothetical protein
MNENSKPTSTETPTEQSQNEKRKRGRRTDLPQVLDGATDFHTDRGTFNPLWLITTLKAHPEYWADLREATEDAASQYGRKRMPGHWALAYLAFVVSKQSDIQPWWAIAGHSIWKTAGFRERPSYDATRRRFAELEDYAAAFERCAAKMIRRAVKKSDGKVGRHIHIDGTEAETHARLEHVCPPWSPCRERRKTKKGWQPVLQNGEKVEYTKSGSQRRLSATEPTRNVRLDRQHVADAPEPEGEDKDKPLIGEADKLTEKNGSKIVKLGDCEYRLLDPTAGVRAYTRDGKLIRFWVGFLNHKAIDHYSGGSMAIHITSASVQEYRAYPELYAKVLRARGGQHPEAVIGDKGFSVREVYEHNTRRGVASVFPWRPSGSRTDRQAEDCQLHDPYGVPKCKHCRRATRFARFSAKGHSGPRLWVKCAAPEKPGCHQEQTVLCKRNWRMLLPLWRTSETYLVLRETHQKYERVHHHWRARYRVGSDDHALRPTRPGLPCQQLRANAALIAEWLMILWREGWLDGVKRHHGDVITGDGKKAVASVKQLRVDLGYEEPEPDVETETAAAAGEFAPHVGPVIDPADLPF